MGRTRRLFTTAALAAMTGWLGLGPLAPPAHAVTSSCALSIDDATVVEGDAGTTTATFTVTETGSAASTTVDYATADGTAAAGPDYQSTSGTLTFSDGATTAAINVPVNGDTSLEDDETFVVNLSNASACSIADSQGAGTITNDDEVPNGYRLTGIDGGVFAFGQSTYLGGANLIDDLRAPIVDIAETPDRAGYWQAGMDGGVFAWGDAPFFGSAASLPLATPILGMAARPQGDGYWLVGLDGGVFAYGDAPFLGALPGDGEHQGAVIVDIVSTSTGMGYWLLDAGGEVFGFGDAKELGNYDARDVEAVGMSATPDDAGYWITNVPGNIIEFGTAEDKGQIAQPESLKGVIADIQGSAMGEGYWLVGVDGGVFAFGDAPFYGSAADLDLLAPIVAIAGKS
jgi:hypothetical protein